MKKTKWFIKNSKQYMAGSNPTPYQWLRAYIRFMWLSRCDGPYGEPKTVDYTKAEPLQLKPGILWTGIDSTTTNTVFEMKNICIWRDGTMRPGRGHNGDCKWNFDGQFWRHL